MPATLFVSIDKGSGKLIVGDAVEKHHQEWIAVNTVDWEVERNTETEGGVNTRGYGKAEFKEVNFESEIGRHTTDLMRLASAGVFLPKVVVHQCKANENESQALTPYIIWTLEDAVVTKYHVDGSAEEVPKESWSIKPSKMEIDYWFPENNGKGKLKKYSEFKWNISEGAFG